eukprot:1148712-Pelagomonas_calceolata.AAC.6
MHVINNNDACRQGQPIKMHAYQKSISMLLRAGKASTRSPDAKADGCTQEVERRQDLYGPPDTHLRYLLQDAEEGLDCQGFTDPASARLCGGCMALEAYVSNVSNTSHAAEEHRSQFYEATLGFVTPKLGVFWQRMTRNVCDFLSWSHICSLLARALAYRSLLCYKFRKRFRVASPVSQEHRCLDTCSNASPNTCHFFQLGDASQVAPSLCSLTSALASMHKHGHAEVQCCPVKALPPSSFDPCHTRNQCLQIGCCLGKALQPLPASSATPALRLTPAGWKLPCYCNATIALRPLPCEQRLQWFNVDGLPRDSVTNAVG